MNTVELVQSLQSALSSFLSAASLTECHCYCECLQSRSLPLLQASRPVQPSLTFSHPSSSVPSFFTPLPSRGQRPSPPFQALPRCHGLGLSSVPILGFSNLTSHEGWHLDGNSTHTPGCRQVGMWTSPCIFRSLSCSPSQVPFHHQDRDLHFPPQSPPFARLAGHLRREDDGSVKA